MAVFDPDFWKCLQNDSIVVPMNSKVSFTIFCAIPNLSIPTARLSCFRRVVAFRSVNFVKTRLFDLQNVFTNHKKVHASDKGLSNIIQKNHYRLFRFHKYRK